MRSGVAPVCVRLCRTPQNRRDTTAGGLKNQPSSHHWPLLRQPDCCCRARRSSPAERFPHRLHPAPAASSLGGFSTRADTGPAATVTPRPASKNLHHCRQSINRLRTSALHGQRPLGSGHRPTLKVRRIRMRQRSQAVRRDRLRRKPGFESCLPFKREEATAAVSYSLSDLGPLTNRLSRR
jgi:hypothetical protein